MAAPIAVFVYGTLRRGGKNHALLQNARFLGMAKTKEQYALYRHDFLYLYKHERISQIIGELYEVNAATLAALDELEGHPDEYKREVIQVITEDGTERDAWIYFYPHKIGKLKVHSLEGCFENLVK